MLDSHSPHSTGIHVRLPCEYLSRARTSHARTSHACTHRCQITHLVDVQERDKLQQALDTLQQREIRRQMRPKNSPETPTILNQLSIPGNGSSPSPESHIRNLADLSSRNFDIIPQRKSVSLRTQFSARSLQATPHEAHRLRNLIHDGTRYAFERARG